MKHLHWSPPNVNEIPAPEPPTSHVPLLPREDRLWPGRGAEKPSTDTLQTKLRLDNLHATHHLGASFKLTEKHRAVEERGSDRIAVSRDMGPLRRGGAVHTQRWLAIFRHKRCTSQWLVCIYCHLRLPFES